MIALSAGDKGGAHAAITASAIRTRARIAAIRRISCLFLLLGLALLDS
jgi:hypothetical protein